MSDIDKIDHGLHGGAHSAKCEAAAKAYLEHQKMVGMMASNKEQHVNAPVPEPEPTPERPVEPAPREVVVSAPEPEPVNHAPVEDPNTDQVIKIPNKHMMFEIAYPNFETGLAVTIKARDINLDEDSLSILMDDSVTLKMPKWQPLYVKVYDILAGEIIRKVVWGGGTHSFGKVKHLSFIIVTEDGKTS